MTSLRINLAGSDGKVLVDGHDLSQSTTAVTLHAHAGEPARASVEFNVIDVTEINAEQCQVAMGPDTWQLLLRAGWIPPAPDTEFHPVPRDNAGLVARLRRPAGGIYDDPADRHEHLMNLLDEAAQTIEYNDEREARVIQPALAAAETLTRAKHLIDDLLLPWGTADHPGHGALRPRWHHQARVDEWRARREALDDPPQSPATPPADPAGSTETTETTETAGDGQDAPGGSPGTSGG